MEMMRKFLIVFFILLVLGGVGFFFGWVQLEVSPGSYGIMRSKTHGMDETLIREGEFRWVWYKLIPTNTDIRVYRPPRIERRISHRGLLPSADVYTSFAAVDVDFNYEFNALLSFAIAPDSLIPLVRDRNILGQDELDAYAASLGQDIEAFVLRRMEYLGEDEDELRRIMETGASASLDRDVLVNFPGIRDFSCRVSQIRFPDFQLYSRLRELYNDYLNRQHDYMSTAMYGNAERHIDSRFRLDELAAYGDLLTRYPVLLEYLKLDLK
jgi:hypothetical protein